jgi:hypothetical protein
MNTKQRITKLESARPAKVDADNRQLVRRICADGNKFLIDGVEVGQAVYEKAERAQTEAAKARGEHEQITVTILDGVQ